MFVFGFIRHLGINTTSSLLLCFSGVLSQLIWFDPNKVKDWTDVGRYLTSVRLLVLFLLLQKVATFGLDKFKICILFVSFVFRIKKVFSHAKAFTYQRFCSFFLFFWKSDSNFFFLPSLNIVYKHLLLSNLVKHVFTVWFFPEDFRCFMISVHMLICWSLNSFYAKTYFSVTPKLS